MDLERMITTIFIAFLILGLHTVASLVYGEIITGQKTRKPSLTVALSSVNDLQSETASVQNRSRSPESANPHWDKTQCNACHIGEFKEGAFSLHTEDHEKLCRECHKDDVAHSYIHPVGLTLTQDKKKIINQKWQGSLPLGDDGGLTCQSCHDVLDQCLPDRSHQVKRNPRFLRGGPYQNRFTLCYRCHDASSYERVNSHDQIAENGMLKMEKCRLCHIVDINDRVKSGIDRDLEHFPILSGMNEDRTLLCVRCHRKIDHPSASFTVKSIKKYRHLVKIEGENKQTLKRQNLETGVVLPIEPYTDRIYCGTCHQSHQSGVFAGEEKSSAKLKNHRLRTDSICRHCHDIYGAIMDTENQE
ncbi:MAG: hypothetical protein AB2792_16555 [Candidatus Thiodiazotropha sp.]